MKLYHKLNQLINFARQIIAINPFIVCRRVCAVSIQGEGDLTPFLMAIDTWGAVRTHLDVTRCVDCACKWP